MIYVLIPIFILVFVGATALTLAWQRSRSDDLLDAWAEENGFEILERHRSWVARGPFFWTTSEGQTVQRIVARDRAGRVRSGWARCGSFMFGLHSSEIDVRWDD